MSLVPVSFLLLLAISCSAGVAESQPAAGQHVFIGNEFVPRNEPGFKAAKSEASLAEGQVVYPTTSSYDAEAIQWLGWSDGSTTMWVPDPLISHVAPENMRTGDLPIGEERVDRWRALPLDYRPSDLVELNPRYTDGGRRFLMRSEAAAKAVEMFAAAKAEGHTIKAISTFRPVSVQRDLYLKKIAAAGYGQQTVARPGNSEHQLGTAMDVNGPDEDTVVVESFGRTAEGKWLKENCQRFGYVISYTEENSALTGYEPEPWHVRYVGIEKAGNWQTLGKP